MNEIEPNRSNEQPDHRAAAIELLRRYADKMERGTPGPDIGEELVLIARVVAQRT